MKRRNLFRAATLAAGAALLPAARAEEAAAAAPAKVGPKMMKGGTELSAPLSPAPNLAMTHTFEPGGSVLTDGVVMNACHWGFGPVHVKGGRIERFEAFNKDQASSLLMQSAAQQPYNRARIRYPMVRKSFLEKGYKAGGQGRGAEPFVRVSWEKAAELIAGELKRVKETYGVESIYAASPAWMSPGSVNNARNVMQRVLNLNGGFTGGTGDYSTGCSQTIPPYVIGSNGVYEQMTSWELIHDKTELILMWGVRSDRHERARLGDDHARSSRRLAKAQDERQGLDRRDQSDPSRHRRILRRQVPLDCAASFDRRRDDARHRL